MPAYIIAEIEVTDPVRYEEYKSQVSATIAAYDGTYLARGGRAETLDGEGEAKRIVVLRFPTFERAKEWFASPEYAPLKTIRREASRARLLLIEGI